MINRANIIDEITTKLSFYQARKDNLAFKMDIDAILANESKKEDYTEYIVTLVNTSTKLSSG